MALPPERQDPAPLTKKRHQSPPPGSLPKPLNQLQLLWADTKNYGNYESAACENETPNTVS